MAKFRIKLIRAYDSSSNGMIGTHIPDMFRPLVKHREIETNKIDDLIEAAVSYAKGYAETHPDESFMPSISIIEGRKPRGYDAKTSHSDSKFREWLKPQPTNV